ncbi:MAG: hypothetical protein ABI675_19385 [Chitinophagaceae bacterium]
MFQTSYLGIVPLHRNDTYVGGFCQFFYIPIEDIDVFPRISSSTQQLIAEPSLKAGKSWYGPIKVPRDKMGFTEVPKRTKAGPYYEIKFSGMQIGDSPTNRVNLENMAYHRYVLAGQVRAGGFYLLIGSPDSFLQFVADYTSGLGPGDTAQSQMSFSTEQITKALIMPSFAADSTAPIDGGDDNNTDPPMNKKEIIPFVATPNINIPWTDDRLGKFGTYPLIQVWILDDGEYFLHTAGEIYPDAPAPAFTELTVKLGGNPTGFIVIA